MVESLSDTKFFWVYNRIISLHILFFKSLRSLPEALGHKNVTLFANNNSGPTSENRKNSDHMKNKSSYPLSTINLKTGKIKLDTTKIGFIVPITR